MMTHKNINHFFTSNKLKVIYAVDHTMPLVSLHLFIRTGSAFETENEAGYSHFIEHLVFKSSTNYPKNSLMDKASELGGVLNAFTEYESTCFYLTLPSEYLEQGLELLGEIAFRANFSKKEFDDEKQVVLEEYKQYQNDPEESLIEVVPALVITDSPYRHTIIGSKQSLTKSTPEQLRTFYKKKYYPENAFLCVAGDFEEKKIKKYVENAFKEWKADALSIDNRPLSIDTSPPALNPLNFKQTHYIKKKLNKDILAFVLPELSDNHPLSNAGQLLAKVFCLGKNSRLYQRLYTKENLVDNIKVSSISGIFNGVMIVIIHPRQNSYIDKIIKIFGEELEDLNTLGVKSDEVSLVKKELINSAGYVYEYMEVLAQTLGNEELLSDYHTFFNYENDIAKISKEDIDKTLRLCYAQDMLHIVRVGKSDKKVVLPASTQHSTITNQRSSNITQYTAKNNLKVLFKHTADKGICGISLAMRVSQLDEDEQTLGLNQLTATAMLYGNEKMDYRQCLQYCSTNGLQFAVSCGKETTKLRLKCFSDNLIEALEFLSDVLSTPTFPNEHIKNIQQSFIGGLHRIKDYPQNEAVYLWKQMIFGKCSNVLSKDGTIKCLSRFNRKGIVDWYRNKILGSPATLCIVGSFDEDKAIYVIEKYFSHLSFSQDSPHRPIFISPSKKNVIIKNKGLDQAIINVGGYCMPARDIEKKAPMNVLGQIIGGEISSRMFTMLREQYPIAYSAEFDYDLLRDLGYYNFFTIVDKAHQNFAIDLLFQIQEALKKDGVTPVELNRAKSFILGQLRIDEESVLSQAQVLSSLLTLGAEYNYYLEREDRIRKVDNDMILDIMNEYFHPEDQYFHILR